MHTLLSIIVRVFCIIQMDKILQQERRIQLVDYMLDLLQGLDFKQSADCLRRQAMLSSQQIQNQIAQIVNQKNITNQQKINVLQKYFKRMISRCLKEGQLQAALEIYEQQVPKYFQNLDTFSQLFAAQTKPTTSLPLLYQYIMQTIDVPEHRISNIQLQNQVWFLKNIGSNILAIDNKSNATVISKNEIHLKVGQLHIQPISAVITNQQFIVTGCMTGIVRVWNYQLNKIYQCSLLKSRVTAMCFYGKGLVVFDNKGNCCYISEINLNQNNTMQILINIKVVQSAVYLKMKKRLLVACSIQQKGQINTFNPQKMNMKNKLITNCKIYSMQVSHDQKKIFLNLSNNQIAVYNTRTYQLECTFSGYKQNNFLMRMSQGGKQNQLLAVTSEDGKVLLFHLNRKELIGKLIALAPGSVNCVAWMGGQLYFGCDSGAIECWSNNPINISSKAQPAKLQQQQDSSCKQIMKTQSAQKQQIIVQQSVQ